MIKDLFITLDLSETDTALLLECLDSFATNYGNRSARIVMERIYRQLEKRLKIEQDVEGAT